MSKYKPLIKLNQALYKSIFEEPTYGEIQITDEEVKFVKQGIFRSLKIYYTGRLFIENKLPDGYRIRITSRAIYIYNMLGRDLSEDLLFLYTGDFDIKKAEALTFSGYDFLCDIADVNKQVLISASETKVEDDTLIIASEEETEKASDSIPTSFIDDDSVKGLYTNIPFKDGYVGYYHYYPKENIYMTGKKLTNESKPILDPKFATKNIKTQRKVAKISRKLAQKQPKIRKERVTTTIERKEIIEPIKKIEEKTKPSGGKY